VREKLTVFLYAQYIVEISGSLAFRGYSQVRLMMGFKRNMQKCNSISDVLALSQQIVAASCYVRPSYNIVLS